MAKFEITPIGPFVGFPWINKPDTKFNADGVFKVDLVLEGAEAEAMKAKIEAAAKAALAEHVDDLPPAKARKFSLYVPYEPEVDDEGEETGRTVFHFKQNATIKTKSGELKKIGIEIRDSRDKLVSVPVYSGCEGRIMFSMRPIAMSSTSQVGVRLDFYKVQVTKLSQGGSSKGFGAVEGGYVQEDTTNEDGAEPEDGEEDY